MSCTARSQKSASALFSAGADGLLEDGRIAGHAAQSSLDEASEFARAEHAAAQVVEPYALPGIEQLLHLVLHRVVS
jgi:hypothetical protein